MTASLSNGLPELLKSVRTRPLFVMRLDVRPLVVTGPTPAALRRLGIVPGGTFEGERLKGQVLDGGNDWRSGHVHRIERSLVRSQDPIGRHQPVFS